MTEHRVLEYGVMDTREHIERQINALARDGWEVSALGGQLVIMRRPMPAPAGASISNGTTLRAPAPTTDRPTPVQARAHHRGRGHP